MQFPNQTFNAHDQIHKLAHNVKISDGDSTLLGYF
jgi:hypothetical protein